MKPKIEIISVIDRIDDCNWSEWECSYSLDGETWHAGSIQSDGHDHAIETLRDENGNEPKPPGEAPWPEVEQLGGKHWPRPDHGQKLIDQELKS